MIFVSCLPAWAQVKVGDGVLRENFDTEQSLIAWTQSGSKPVTAPGYENTPSLRIEATSPQSSRGARIALPAEKIRGLRLNIGAMVKAEDVSKPEQSWNGIKVMLHTVSPNGPRWTNVQNVYGTFDWKPVRLGVAVPDDITEAWLCLGLQGSTGRVWFDNVSVGVAAVPRSRPAKPAAYRPEERRTNLPRLRGFMYGPRVSEEDLHLLADWNVNFIRWQLHWVVGGKHDGWRDLAAYDRWLETSLVKLDQLLPVCEKLGIQVLVDLHTPPGGGINLGAWELFQQKQYQDKFLEVWDKIARRYKNSKAVWGYDLANEPVEGYVAEGLMDWHTLATKAAKLVRSIDPDRAIVVESGPGGGWEGLEYFEPLDVPGVVYSPHMYVPGEFTHQGVHGSPTGVAYPGEIKGKKWDKDALRRALDPVRQYQLDYGVPIYIGEFSAIRWAPGAAAYLRDVIEIFEEYGWDWSYHAFREWNGWSVEHGPDAKDTKPSASETDRQKLLKEWFAKNQRSR